MADASYRALLIGNSTFPLDSQNLQSLEGPVNDVALLRDALTDPEVGLLAPSAVRMVPERTASEILIEMEQFFANAGRTDSLVLYYSGHGLLDQDNQLHLCARDSRTDLMRATTVSAAAVNAMIDGSSSQTTIILLDCCYSGAFKSGQLPDSLRGSGRFLLTSCRSGQLANDADRRNGTSMFTQHLVDGLVEGAKDPDGDGFVDLGDLYRYVYGQLAAQGRQIPQRNFSGGGDVAIARREAAGGAGRAGDNGKAQARRAADREDGSTTAPHAMDGQEPVIDLRQAPTVDEVTPARARAGAAPPPPGSPSSAPASSAPASSAPASSAPTAPAPASAAPATPAQFAPGPGVESDRAAAARPADPRRPPTAAFKVVAVVLLVVLVAGGIAVAAGRGGTSRTAGLPKVTEVTVPGHSDDPAISAKWNGTGIIVKSGDQVEIEATGRVSHAPEQFVGPDGEANRPDFDQYSVVKGAPHAGLIARFGDGGEPVFAGGSSSFDDVDGELFLGVNDVGHFNNGGQFEVTVTVTPSGDG